MEKKITQIISKVLKKKKIELKDSPKTIPKWDSLCHLDIISSLNKSLKVQISFEDTIKIKNVEDIIKVYKKYIKK